MMKITCFVILASILLATAACAVTTYTETLYIDNAFGSTGNNWIALRGVPFDPSPAAIFPAPEYADGYLFKLDPITQNNISWSMSEPWNMLLGEGYWVQNPDVADYTITYVGIDDGVPDASSNMTDMWISLPGQDSGLGGWHWIGMPFNHSVAWLDILVTDGTKTIPIYADGVENAVELGWIDYNWEYLDGASQSTYAIDPFGTIDPGNMYRVQTFKSNIALIIPA